MQLLTDTARADWSPDGSKIIFASNRAGNYDIYWIKYDLNTTRIEIITLGDWDSRYPAWKPPGKNLIP